MHKTSARAQIPRRQSEAMSGRRATCRSRGGITASASTAEPVTSTPQRDCPMPTHQHTRAVVCNSLTLHTPLTLTRAKGRDRHWTNSVIGMRLSASPTHVTHPQPTHPTQAQAAAPPPRNAPKARVCPSSSLAHPLMHACATHGRTCTSPVPMHPRHEQSQGTRSSHASGLPSTRAPSQVGAAQGALTWRPTTRP
jgi:hypothetical protein